jgi:uncharacterized protein (DUF1684 family)
MAYHPQSPLAPVAEEDFDGLHYYPENPDYLYDVVVERFDSDEPLIEMPTSTGDTEQYRRWGRFEFYVDDMKAALVIYTDPEEGDYFLPFKDATNGRETYGAGRYLDSHRPGLRHLRGNHFEVDFNYAYNPYCAYSDNFRCPLPPSENWIKVPIRAGEKKFKS